MSSISQHFSVESGDLPYTETAPRFAGLIAGIGYLLLFALAVFANFFVREGLIVHGDAVVTAANITQAEGLFRAGMLSFLIVFLLDIPIAWALYVLFRGVHRDLSLLSAWFRIIYTVFMGVGLIFFFQALQFLSGSEFLETFNSGQLNASALVALDTFNSTWLIGLTAFGVHLVLMGIILLKSRAVTKILGWVLIIAGAAYITDTIAHTLLADYAKYAGLLTAIVAIPSVLSEGWFGIWLLVKGGR